MKDLVLKPILIGSSIILTGLLLVFYYQNLKYIKIILLCILFVILLIFCSWWMGILILGVFDD